MMLVEKSFDTSEVVLNYTEGPDNRPPLLLIYGWGQSSEGWGARAMDGMIAQQLSLSHQDVIRSLTLCCTSPGGPKSVLGKTLDNTEASELMEDISDVSITQMWNLFYTFTRKKDDKRLRALLDRLESWRVPARYSTNPTESIVWYEQFKTITGYDSSSRLNEIHAPTLMLLGELDDVFPPINSELLSGGIPNSRLVVFNDAGHLFLWAKTEEVASTVLDFLKSLK